MKATALIAEDEPILAQALSSMLKRHWPDLTVLPVAADGGQAVDMALAYLNGEEPKFTDAATKTLNVPVKLVTPETLEEFKKNLK